MVKIRFMISPWIAAYKTFQVGLAKGFKPGLRRAALHDGFVEGGFAVNHYHQPSGKGLTAEQPPCTQGDPERFHVRSVFRFHRAFPLVLASWAICKLDVTLG
jgi:hypothetical protein